MSCFEGSGGRRKEVGGEGVGEELYRDLNLV